MTTTAPPSPPKAPPPPPPQKAPPPPNSTANTPRNFTVNRGVVANKPEIVGIYGPGGIGKSSLIASLKSIGKKPLVLDVGRSTANLDVDRISDIGDWDGLLAALRDDSLWKGYDVVAIDDFTAAQEFAVAWTLANVPRMGKGGTVYMKRIKDYGYGDGDVYVFETFLQLLAALDRHFAAGRSIVFTAHDHAAKVPNPVSDDYRRYEPRLLNSNQGNVTARVREWCDHLLFLAYDVAVGEDGKAKGSGTRTIYPLERPTHMAKSRSLKDPIVYTEGDVTLWNRIFNTGALK